MKKIEIKIDSKSKSAKVFKGYIAEKMAFKTAVMSGSVSSFVKETGKKFDTPISLAQ